MSIVNSHLIITPITPLVFLCSPFCHFIMHSLHHTHRSPFILSILPSTLLLHHVHYYHFLSKGLHHIFLTLSSLVTSSTLKNIISHACILLLCFLCMVVLHPYTRLCTHHLCMEYSQLHEQMLEYSSVYLLLHCLVCTV